MIPSPRKQIAGGFASDGAPNNLFLSTGYPMSIRRSLVWIDDVISLPCETQEYGLVCKLAAENRCWIGSTLRAIDIASS